MTSNAVFKKQVRTLATEENIPYAEARTRLLAQNGQSAPADGASGRRELQRVKLLIGELVIARAAELAAADRRLDLDEEQWIAAREAEGFRVVEDGQAGRYNADGKTPWEIRDWRTGELLVEGVSTHAEMPWDDSWVDISSLSKDVDYMGAPRVAFDRVAGDLPPQLRAFLDHLLNAIDEGEWSQPFGHWLEGNS